MDRPYQLLLRAITFLLGLMIAAALGLAAPADARAGGAGVSAAFNPATGVLTVRGDPQRNSITVGRDGAGALLINGGAVPIAGGPATVAGTSLIELFGLGQDDQIALDASNGPLPGVRIAAGAGDDTVTVLGADADEAFAASGAGAHIRIERTSPSPFALDVGGAEHLALQAGGGRDTVAIAGDDDAEVATLTAQGGAVRFERSYPDPFVLDIAAAEELALATNGGADAVGVGVGVDQMVQITVDGRALAAGEAVVEAQPTGVAQSAAAITASFSPSTGLLSIFGDGLDNAIAVSRNAAGNIRINGGAVPILGGAPTIANTRLIQVFGLDGSDTISLNEGNGALPQANLFGGAGADALTGGSGADQIFGQAGDDSLQGRGGGDLLFGGEDNDALRGGPGDDQVFGEGGADRLIWGSSDGSDLAEGGDGSDSVEVNGSSAAESFSTTANGARVRFDVLSPTASYLDIGTAEGLILKAGGGSDSFSAIGNLAALIQISVDGGAGDDTLLGGNGADTLSGGGGRDFVDGNQGNDTILLGAGDDTFQWDPGDGSDTIEGQAGADTLRFNGSNIGEVLDVSANGKRISFLRNVGNIALDLSGVERIDLTTLGGADALTVNDLSGTDLRAMDISLALADGVTGDGQADQVVVRGTASADQIEVGGGGDVTVAGLPVLVSIAGAEGANDSLAVEALAGDDVISAGASLAGAIQLTADGGAEQDTFRFSGSDEQEAFDLSAYGARARLYRYQGAMTSDLNAIEAVELSPLGGADSLVINDVSGTGLTAVSLNLAGAPGGTGGDGEADSVQVNGTSGADAITVGGSAADGLVVAGLPATVSIERAEADLDRLSVNALAGVDTVDASALAADQIVLTLDGGLDSDAITGSQGGDTIVGNRGDDQLAGGAGDDTFRWNPGDGSDTIEGQGGADALLFNGANVAEQISIAASGGRVRFTRDIASIVTDLNGVEAITYNALGGADNIAITDMSGTDLVAVSLNLAALGGAGDGQIDSVTIAGTSGNDAVVVFGDALGATVQGLAAQVNITGAEAASDRLSILAQEGDDAIDASGLAAGAIQLTLNGGDHDDVLIGGAGDDVLFGGDGDDVLLGGPGIDVLDGGPGNNILIQD